MTSRFENTDNGLWARNDLQFPRLLAEIAATQALDLEALSEAMDLEEDAIDELLERAQTKWAKDKADLRRETAYRKKASESEDERRG